MKTFNIKNKRKGFTLLETVVAIFILLISITGPMVVAQNGLRTAFISRDQISAFFLAQDAIEYIKNVKDTNGVSRIEDELSSDNWLNGLNDCFDNNGCQIDSYVGETFDCSPASPSNGCLGSNPENDSKLKYDSDAGFYRANDGNQDSIFSRTVYLEEIDPDKEARVTVKIRWRGGGLSGFREIIVTEYITNWVSAIID
jgi:prepilin-type N-terminal cleavage/methylation domain-containing protein